MAYGINYNSIVCNRTTLDTLGTIKALNTLNSIKDRDNKEKDDGNSNDNG